jgi:uncharacterized protein (TIGR02466 family)
MHNTDSNIKHWFSTPIYCTQLSTLDKNEYLANKALELKSKVNKSITNWRCGTYNTLDSYDWYSDQDPIVMELIESCRTEVYKFSKTFGINLDILQLECKDFWFNVANESDYQEYHQHTDSHFSVSYYIQTPPSCGNIVFKSFESMFDMYSLPIEEGNLQEASFKTCSYTPKESMLLIFRSNLLHMVEKNTSTESRISVSMNFKFNR